MRFSAKRHFFKANKAKEDGSTVLFRFQWKESKNPVIVLDLSVQNECQTDGEPRKNDERNGSLIPQGNKKRRGERNADDERSRADGAAVFRDVLLSDVPALSLIQI